MSSSPNDVFVGQLGPTTTEEQLRETFSVVGNIKNIRLIVDKDTGRLKGYAFVEYTNVDSVNAAIRLLDK
jgi:RNA recognition motif-containing protein